MLVSNYKKKYLICISFFSINACTPTSLKNIMKRVSTILNSKASEVLRVTQSIVDEVLSNNISDVRSALLNIIFSSLKGSLIFFLNLI